MSEKRELLTRFGNFVREKIDREKRTCEMAFSSELPVERWGKSEVLSHGEGDYDFGRLNNAHPLLLSHDAWDASQQIGVVERAWVADKKGRAIVRFSKSPLAEQIFQDVIDGIRQHVSVGYEHLSMIRSEKAENGMETCYYKWAPYEISLVSVPADDTVGIGRSKKDDTAQIDTAPLDVTRVFEKLDETQRKTMRTLLDAKAEDGGSATPPNNGLSRKEWQAQERERTSQIDSIADTLIKDFPNHRELVETIAKEARNSEKSVADYKTELFEKVLRAKPAKGVFMRDLGASDRDKERYSILRGIQRCLELGRTVPDGLEGELHQEISKRKIGIQTSGFLVPADAGVRCRPRNIHERDMLLRDLNVTNFGQGGATVQTTIVLPIIEILRNRMVTQRLGVQSMAGLEGNIAIPRQTGPATAYSLAESATLTESTQALDQVVLTPRRIGAFNEYTKQLLLQSSIDVENFIRDDLMKVIAIRWDLMILAGSGANSQPTGILNTVGVSSRLFGGTPDWSDIVGFETDIAAANADVANMAYVTTAAGRGRLKTIAKTGVGVTSVVPIMLWDGTMGDGTGDQVMNGYRAAMTNQIPNDLLFFGNFEDIIHALWGGYDVVVNPYSRDTDAAVRITVNTFGDVAIRHPQSFSVSGDAATQ